MEERGLKMKKVLANLKLAVGISFLVVLILIEIGMPLSDVFSVSFVSIVSSFVVSQFIKG